MVVACTVLTGPKVNAPATSIVVVQGADVEVAAEIEAAKVEATVSGSRLFFADAGVMYSVETTTSHPVGQVGQGASTIDVGVVGQHASLGGTMTVSVDKRAHAGTAPQERRGQPSKLLAQLPAISQSD
jgi:hypothetical protein